MAGKGGARPGAGRPRIQFDWSKIKQACFVQCTPTEISHIFECDLETLDTACKREHGIDISTFHKIHSEGGKSSLRRAMFKKALEGNTTMMIWLSKNYMGMKENWNLPENIAPIFLAYNPQNKPQTALPNNTGESDVIDLDEPTPEEKENYE